MSTFEEPLTTHIPTPTHSEGHVNCHLEAALNANDRLYALLLTAHDLNDFFANCRLRALYDNPITLSDPRVARRHAEAIAEDIKKLEMVKKFIDHGIEMNEAIIEHWCPPFAAERKNQANGWGN